MRHLLLTLSLLLPTCTAQSTSPQSDTAARSAAQVAFLSAIKTGNSALDDVVRAACRKTLENHGYKVVDRVESAQIVIQIEVRQLAQADADSAGKFLEFSVTDAKTHRLVSRNDQDAGRASDTDIVHAAEFAVSEFIHPSIPPPPTRQ